MEIHSPREFIAQMREMIKFMEKLHQQEFKGFQSSESQTERLKDFTELRMMLKLPIWPKAVEDDQILNDSVESNNEKAILAITSLIRTDIENKNILNIGYKKDYEASVLLNTFYAKKFVGYNDAIENKVETNKKILTDDWEQVRAHAPYDIIYANDVLDHSQDFDKSLENIKDLRTDKCKIYVRCHPWSSRHGAHLHEEINKAFVHLVFTEDELSNMGYNVPFIHRLLDPLTSYRNLFKKVGYTILSEDIIKTTIEPFFYTNEKVAKRIKEKWQTMSGFHNGQNFPRQYMDMEIVDFVLI